MPLGGKREHAAQPIGPEGIARVLDVPPDDACVADDRVRFGADHVARMPGIG
jgi:hypothetical protein